MEQKRNKKILLHACCGICSAYPIFLLKEIGYELTVYFCNPNIDTETEFIKRLEAQRRVCEHYNVNLIIEDYRHEKYLEQIIGLENEPEKGSRCEKCIDLRLKMTAQKAKELKIKEFTTSLVISPHKNFEKITKIGEYYSEKYSLQYLPINFRKNNGFLKTNSISKELNLYRQNYCACEFAKNHIHNTIQ